MPRLPAAGAGSFTSLRPPLLMGAYRQAGAPAVRCLFWNEVAGEFERYLLTETESPSALMTLPPVRSPR